MGYDAIQCTRAYLLLWKLVDRLFPESKWLEIGPVVSSELRANAERLVKAPDLSWCDEPAKLRERAAAVLALRGEAVEEGTIARAEQLRAELRDKALEYARDIEPGTEEWSHTFDWELQKPDGA